MNTFRSVRTFGLCLLALTACEPISTTVTVATADLRLDTSSITLEAGETKTVSAQALSASGAVLGGRTVDWRSEDPTIASVSVSGEITGLRVGSTNVTAFAEGLQRSIPVTVTEGMISRIAIQLDSVLLTSLGDTARITVTAWNRFDRPVSAQGITFTTGDASVATVSAQGTVTGLRVGTTTLTARHDTVSASRPVRVVQVPAEIQVEPASVFFATPGHTQTLQARLFDARSNPIDNTLSLSWVSRNPGIASVSQLGTVTGIGRGTAEIVASHGAYQGVASVRIPEFTLVLGLPLDVRAVRVSNDPPTDPLLSQSAPRSVFAMACSRCLRFNIQLDTARTPLLSWAAGQLCQFNQYGPRPPKIRGHDGVEVLALTCCPHGAPCSAYPTSSAGGADFLIAVTAEGRVLTRLEDVRRECDPIMGSSFTAGALEYSEIQLGAIGLQYPDLGSVSLQR